MEHQERANRVFGRVGELGGLQVSEKERREYGGFEFQTVYLQQRNLPCPLFEGIVHTIFETWPKLGQSYR